MKYHADRVGPPDKHAYEVCETNDISNYRVVQVDPLDCDCGDATYRNQICKHLIAALYADGDPETVEIYGRLENKLSVDGLTKQGDTTES